MAQSNYNIPNESAPAVRAQLNAVFQSIATNNSGSSAPTTTFAHQWWYDSTTNILKQRNAADSAWIDIGTFDQSGGTFTPAGIVELSQGQVEDDTSTVFGTVSGQRLAQAVAANVPAVDTAAVLAATAGATAGAVGTYAFLASTNAANFGNTAFGDTRAGSSLHPAGARGGQNFGGDGTPGTGEPLGTGDSAPAATLSGTWRCVGRADAVSSGAVISRRSAATLWLRIS